MSGAKPQVLTVEEIEAQLNCSHIQPSESRPVIPERLPMTGPEKANDEILKQLTPSPNLGSNLAPMLQSLALKQQQQVVCAQSVQLRSALNTIGMLSNPMVRLPTSVSLLFCSGLRLSICSFSDVSVAQSYGLYTLFVVYFLLVFSFAAR